MPWLEDLITKLQGDSVGTYGTDIFVSSKSAPPVLLSGQATLTIVETGGTSPQKTQNAVIRPAIVRPGAQLTARAADYMTARAKAHLAYDTIVQVRNQFINSGWYMEIVPLQEPFDGGLDARGQAQCQFNILGKVGIRPW